MSRTILPLVCLCITMSTVTGMNRAPLVTTPPPPTTTELPPTTLSDPFAAVTEYELVVIDTGKSLKLDLECHPKKASKELTGASRNGPGDAIVTSGKKEDGLNAAQETPAPAAKSPFSLFKNFLSKGGSSDSKSDVNSVSSAPSSVSASPALANSELVTSDNLRPSEDKSKLVRVEVVNEVIKVFDHGKLIIQLSAYRQPEKATADDKLTGANRAG